MLTPKRYTTFSMLLVILTIFSMCLPYERIDRVPGDPGATYRDGFYFLALTWISPLTILLLWGLVTRFNNLAMAILSSVLSVIHLFYVFALGVLISLDLNFIGPRTDSYPWIGYFILILVALAYIILTSMHLSAYSRRARESKTHLN